MYAQLGKKNLFRDKSFDFFFGGGVLFFPQARKHFSPEAKTR